MTTGQKSQQSFNPRLFGINCPVENIHSIATLPHSYHAVLDTMLLFDGNFETIFVSQSRIAVITGYSVRTVKRALKYWRSCSWLWSQRRFNKTCIYKLAAWLYHHHVRIHLAEYFPFLRKSLHVAMLYAIMPSVTGSGESGPLSKFKSYFNNISLEEYSYVASSPMEIVIQKEINGKEVVMSQPQRERLPVVEAMMEGSKRSIDPIPDYIRLIPELPLTVAGMAKLSGFNVETILAARKQFIQRRRYKDNLRDPYAYFYESCYRYAKDHSFKYENKVVNAIIEAYQIKALTDNWEKKKGLPSIEPVVLKSTSRGTPRGYTSNSQPKEKALSFAEYHERRIRLEQRLAECDEKNRSKREAEKERQNTLIASLEGEEKAKFDRNKDMFAGILAGIIKRF